MKLLRYVPVLAALLVAAAIWSPAQGLGGHRGDDADPVTTSAVSSPGGAAVAVTTTRAKGPDGLDPGLVAAYEQARAGAADDGYALVINSGYRTPERQQELLDEEVAKRGSYEEANRWVFTPDRSMHVQGLAIDVGDRAAAAWLKERGAEIGLCHTLSWEWWHFEWRQRWQDAGSCPAEAADPSEAPGP